MMIKVKLKNGKTGILKKDVYILFDDYDQYTYTVPVQDIQEIEVKKDVE